MKVLELNSIQKSYGPVKALNGISFDVPEGSIFGILGPNGSGKTTLLGIILDVLKADAGSFRWFGEDYGTNSRKRIGSLLETPNFYQYLSASRNLEITSMISGRGTSQEIDQVLRDINLHERKTSPFRTYSLGMKQRLAIGGALLGEPQVIVLDEPTNGLDPVGIAEIRQLILNLHKKGHTIIIASHLLDEVEKICTHVAIMKKGSLLTCGPVDQVLADEDWVETGARDLDELYTVIGTYPGLLRNTIENGRVLIALEKGKADLEKINSFCIHRGVILNHLYLRKQRLEARFFELTQN